VNLRERKKKTRKQNKKNDYIGSPVCAHHTRGQVGTGQPLVGGIFFFSSSHQRRRKETVGKEGIAMMRVLCFGGRLPLCAAQDRIRRRSLRLTWESRDRAPFSLSLSLILFLSAAQPPYSSSSSLLTQQSSAERLTSQSHLSFVAWLSAYSVYVCV